MLGEKRNDFMADIRKQKRFELINRRRLLVLPDAILEVESGKFGHLDGHRNREQIIELSKQIEGSKETLSVSLL